MVWNPTISDREGPLYRRIADALAEDIATGRLGRGEQLPTQRALAKALDVDLSTVSHAYRDARTRGLIEARVGQGTFVAETMSRGRLATDSWTSFDLSMNLPPHPLDADIEGGITRGIAGIARETGFTPYLNYRAPGGLAEERAAAAHWLRGRLGEIDPARLVIFPGAQCALGGFLTILTAPGDTVLTENITYPGIKGAAVRARVTLRGVATDADGILPDALDATCQKYMPKALYLVPTIHNPTTVTMPRSRRKDIAKVLARHRVVLLEDDAYGALEPDATPFVSLSPELTWHVSTISKCIAPGLRLAFAIAPDATGARALSEALRIDVQMTAPLMIALFTRWIRDGSADAIAAAIREEARARQTLAREILAGREFAARPTGHHLWLPLPSSWTPAEFVAHVRRQGLAIVGGDAFHIAGPAPNAVRVALGAAASRRELTAALSLLVSALDMAPPDGVIV